MNASRDKENQTHQNSADAADHRNGTATGETIQICLIPVHYDQYPKTQKPRTRLIRLNAVEILCRACREELATKLWVLAKIGLSHIKVQL